MGPLDGKVALVTGASRGIGRAVALELARAGARVAVNYHRSEAEARALAREIGDLRSSAAPTSRWPRVETGDGDDGSQTRGGTVVVAEPEPERSESGSADLVMLAQADVSRSQEARRLVAGVADRWGRLDILVNNAGITRDRTLRRLSDDDWLSVIETNLSSAFFCTSAAIAVMLEQQYGRIVNISSVIGQAGNIGQANYAAAKGGMIALTKCAALELARYNITVNCVAPGFTATDMLARVPENIQEQIRAKIPLGRFARPEEIARAVLFLVADGGYITGQQINVNGGLYL